MKWDKECEYYEQEFGSDAAELLMQYCDQTGMEPDTVVYNPSQLRKFNQWAYKFSGCPKVINVLSEKQSIKGEQTMKKIKEGSENNPRFKMMEGGVTLREIEKWYGKDTADALVEYCDTMEKEIDQVADSDREWDKFERWTKTKGARRDKIGKKIRMGTDSSKFDHWLKAAKMDNDGKKRKGNEYSLVDNDEMFQEGSGSQRDEQDILDFITEELYECEGVSDIDYDDYEAKCQFTLDGEKQFEITVKRI